MNSWSTMNSILKEGQRKKSEFETEKRYPFTNGIVICKLLKS
jgi:hypothetical protein